MIKRVEETYNSNKTIRIQNVAIDLTAVSDLVDTHCATLYTATTNKGRAARRLYPVFLVSKPKVMCVEIIAKIQTATTTTH